jgi:hypothetical protein
MQKPYKKYLMSLMFVFICLGMARGLAYGTLINLNGIADAGLYPGEPAFARYVSDSDPNTILYNYNLTNNPPDPKPQSASDVYNFAYYNAKISNWELQSAGDIWSNDTIVGESLTNLPAGTYRITPVGGAYMYDSWDWTTQYAKLYWWELQIQAQKIVNGIPVYFDYPILGSTQGKTSALEAFQDVQNQFLDITLTEGWSLYFWIYDTNSIDNSGELSFNVTPVPEPSTLILLTLGLSLLLWRFRKQHLCSMVRNMILDIRQTRR